jgi:hypothetical protein
MATTESKYEFAAPVLRYVEGGMTWHYVPLPDEVADGLIDDGVRRVIATINHVPFNRAILRRRTGERYIVASRSLLRDVSASFGDTVIVDIKPDPNPNAPEIPEELVAALDNDPEAASRFYGMTPGKQRSLSHYVSSAKRQGTREKRALELAYKLSSYTLHSDSARKPIDH